MLFLITWYKKYIRRMEWGNALAFFVLLFFLGIVATEALFLIFNGFAFSCSDVDYFYLSRFRSFFSLESRNDSVRFSFTSQTPCAVRDFTVPKPENTLRVFFVGTSLGRRICFENNFVAQLNALDDNRKKVEIINCCKDAFNVERIRKVFDEVIELDPDLIVVISTLRFDDIPFGNDIHSYYINAFLRNFHTYCFFQHMFRNHCYFGRKNKKTDLNRIFEKNLRLMAQSAKDKQVPVVLCTIPVNLRDCPPTFPSKPIDYGADYWQAELETQKGNYDKAVSLLERFSEEKPGNPIGYFEIGRILYKQKRFPEAREKFLQAIEHDSRHVRTKPEANDIIRQVARDYGSMVMLADLEREFDEISEGGCAGLDVFLDDTHWIPKMDAVVFYAIARSLFLNASSLPDIVSENAKEPVMIEITSKQDSAYTRLLDFVPIVMSYYNLVNISDFASVFLPVVDGVSYDFPRDEDLIRRVYNHSLANNGLFANSDVKSKFMFRMFFSFGEFYRRQDKPLLAQKYFDKVLQGAYRNHNRLERLYFSIALNYLAQDNHDEFVSWLDRAEAEKLRNTGKGINDLERLKAL